MNVNKNQTPIVIGIDHGYGNIKTASSCFRTSVKAYDTEPTFTGNMLVYNGRYYIIGEGHKEEARECARGVDKTAPLCYN